MPSPDTESTGGNKVTGHGDYGPRDNDVRGSMRSFGQNRDQNPKSRDRDGGADKRGDAEKDGARSKEIQALAAKISNIEAFLKAKMEYDPKHVYAKDKPEEARTAEPAAKVEPVKLPRRAMTLPHFDY